MKLDGWAIRRADEMEAREFEDSRIILESEELKLYGFWLFPPNGAYAIWASEEGIGGVLSHALDAERR